MLWCPVDKRQVGSGPSLSAVQKKEKVLLPLLEIESSVSGHPFHSLVTVLSRLRFKWIFFVCQ